MAESEATKAVERQLRDHDSLDAIPQLREKSCSQLQVVERKIRLAVRNQAISFKRVTDAISLIDYEFHELSSNVTHIRALCSRQHESLLNSALPSSTSSRGGGISNGIRSSLGTSSIAAAKRSKTRRNGGNSSNYSAGQSATYLSLIHI